MKQNEAHIVLELHMKELGMEFEPEYRFSPERAWRFDYLVTHWPHFPVSSAYRVAIEIEGGSGYFKNPRGQVIRGGRHNRTEGYQADLLKYNTAAKLGYCVLRFSTQEVLNGKAKEFLEQWSKP